MFRFRVYPECTKQVDLLNPSSLVTVSAALSRPRAAKAKLRGKATNARQSGSYGNSLMGSEPGTEGRVCAGRPRHYLWKEEERGRYGMVVREWFDPTTVPRQREHRWPRFNPGQGRGYCDRCDC
ncbi:unnamed protein product [Lasius platythorax]|uniref:Uncharacterized protein n=1 Tax=Lasius platythorax TaxID=488582 RepID=A0AAV2P854_9HYME